MFEQSPLPSVDDVNLAPPSNSTARATEQASFSYQLLIRESPVSLDVSSLKMISSQTDLRCKHIGLGPSNICSRFGVRSNGEAKAQKHECNSAAAVVGPSDGEISRVRIIFDSIVQPIARLRILSYPASCAIRSWRISSREIGHDTSPCVILGSIAKQLQISHRVPMEFLPVPNWRKLGRYHRR